MECSTAVLPPPPPYSTAPHGFSPDLKLGAAPPYLHMPATSNGYHAEKISLHPATATPDHASPVVCSQQQQHHHQAAPAADTKTQQPMEWQANMVYPPGMPPEKREMIQQMMAQYNQHPATSSTIGQIQTDFPPPPPTPMPVQGFKPLTTKDEKKAGKVQRFLGDTLVGRFARASVQTATSTLKMPAALSPWGDNNPVTLPNVRYRDAILFTTFAAVGTPLIEAADGAVSDIFGPDSFVAEIVYSGAGAVTGCTILKYGIFQIVEQAIDKGILEHLLPEEEKMITTTNVKSLQVGIKHKLMGVDADLRFWGTYPASDTGRCGKGWFCPYLFASSRTPIVPRANDFGVAQFFGPFVGADYALAHKLLAESVHVMSMCDSNPNVNIGVNRMIVLFTGIAPFRGKMWSTSRRPGCATIIFHLLNGCPALVLPVNNNAPIMAWSPWTLLQMRSPSYKAEIQHEQLCEYLDTIISMEHLQKEVQARYVEVLGRAVSLVINGALALKTAGFEILGKVDPERAGIVMFRY